MSDASSGHRQRRWKQHCNGHEQAFQTVHLPQQLSQISIFIPPNHPNHSLPKKDPLTVLSIHRVCVFIWRIAPQHLLILTYPNALALHDLHIMQPRQNLMLNLELRRHGELCPLFDLEGVVFQSGQSTRGTEVDGDGGAVGRVHGEREDDAEAWIVGVREVFAAAAEA